MERVFQAVPADLRMKMEALVQDLTNALEESSRLPSSRRRWGLRRRARSTGNLPAVCHKTQSDDSSSSIGELMHSRDKGLSSLHQSDSDDVISTGGVHRQLVPLTRKTRPAHFYGNFESDSFNENFSPVHPNTRRKRKCKRMAVDPVGIGNPSTSHATVPVLPLTSGKKKRAIKHSPNCENKYNNLLCGKRKRSMRERSVDCERPSAGGPGSRSKTSRILAIHKMSLSNPDESRMEFDSSTAAHCEIMSSSSLSSSESDTGIYTNDEGREGDDEQSDWWGGDAGSVCGRGWWEEEDEQTSGPSQVGGDIVTDVDEDSDSTFHAILTGSLDPLSEEMSKQAYRVNMQWLREGLDPGQSELRLHPMQKQERDQLCHLANLYSLQMSSDPNRRTCPVLTKTRNTMQAVRVEQVRLTRLQARLHHFGDFKRRRKMPPGTGTSVPNMPSHSPSDVGSSAPSIPESNVGPQLTRGLGWEPGTGLASQSNGIQEPIVTPIRPKYVGLSHISNHKSS
ncbi:G patch domain-containing protein 2 isoform X2 [Periplaneta americana]|uniref:G patch domain-containing protein 2 isoform X2 n=1 Tax=Periplaneta americana TaxID=6978 RepID=UPI0037E8DE0D